MLSSIKLPMGPSWIDGADVSPASIDAGAGEAETGENGVTIERSESLGHGEGVQRGSAPDPGPVSILFTDLEGSTELLNRLGDDGNRDLLRVHNNVIRELVSRYSGTEVKSMGDGFMVVFPNPVDAAQCAVDIQRSLERHNLECPENQLKIRIGINVGDAIKEDGDLFGNAVVLAARAMRHALGGQILVSEQFRKSLDGAGELSYVDRGWKRLKGYPVRQHLYEIVWSSGST